MSHQLWRVRLLQYRQRHEQKSLDSRAFSKLDKFWSERTRWHDWAAVLQSDMSNVNAGMHIEMLQVEGTTAVTPNVAVINFDSVARSKSLHSMPTMLVEGPAVSIMLNRGSGRRL